MENLKLKQLVFKALKQDDRVWNEDKTELNQVLLLDLLERTDQNIIDLLLQDPLLKEKFFVKIKNICVFKMKEFRFFMEGNKINNSYTSYKNRIGLTDGRRLLKDTHDVVLEFPYKDCILEGGQSKEEGIDIGFTYNADSQTYEKKQFKRKEIFFNQILAQDEIDRLFDEKALVNWTRVCGEDQKSLSIQDESIGVLQRDKNGVIKENLMIKGNNLLALHSLKKLYAEKVKLIYIDPPFNTGGDANIFTYNNAFNHSTWLAFMKNRLEVAKGFLREDGFICMAIDHCELFYLGVLADEIFGRDNRVGLIAVRHFPGGRTDSKYFAINSEYMLVYAKNSNIAHFNRLKMDKKAEQEYKHEDKISKYKLRQMMRDGDVNSRPEDRPNLYYPIYVKSDLSMFSIDKKEDFIEVLPIKNETEKRVWDCSKETFIQRANKGEIIAKRANQNRNKINLFKKIRDIDYKGKKLTTIWYDSRYSAGQNGKALLRRTLGYPPSFSYPKSLYVIQDVLKIMTDKNDIILDFFAGSGTTGHAVLEQNREDGGARRFILIEQLDEHIDICRERMQKVLESNSINDDFIYFELAKWNEQAKGEINNCQSLEALEKLFDLLYAKYFLNYNLKIKEFKEKVLKESRFRNLSLDEQKSMFLAMLDLNQMYVCQSEMEDQRFQINKEEQKQTKAFYKNF